MWELRRLLRPDQEAYQTMSTEDKVRRTKVKHLEDLEEDLKEHGARVPKKVEVSLFRRCNTENIFLSIHKLVQ